MHTEGKINYVDTKLLANRYNEGRLVACWNYFVGFATEDIQYIGSLDRVIDMVSERHELLEACKAAQLALRATSKKEKDYTYELNLLTDAINKATNK